MMLLKKTIQKIRQHFPIQIQNTFIFQLLFFTSLKQSLDKQNISHSFFIPESVRRESSKKKKILVLDMDETLVYTRRPEKPNHPNYLSIDGDYSTTMYIEERPLLQQFLRATDQIFEIYIYTAGDKKYADKVLDKIDLNGVIKRRFYRQSCRKYNGAVYKDLKHLKKISKNNCEMILVDDNTLSSRHNFPMSIQIASFEGDQKDQQLHKVFLKLLQFY